MLGWLRNFCDLGLIKVQKHICVIIFHNQGSTIKFVLIHVDAITVVSPRQEEDLKKGPHLQADLICNGFPKIAANCTEQLPVQAKCRIRASQKGSRGGTYSPMFRNKLSIIMHKRKGRGVVILTPPPHMTWEDQASSVAVEKVPSPIPIHLYPLDPLLFRAFTSLLNALVVVS